MDIIDTWIKQIHNIAAYRDLSISDIIACEIMKSIVVCNIENLLPCNITVEDFFERHHIYFCKGTTHSSSGEYIYASEGRYFLVSIGDKGEIERTTQSKYWKDIMFNLFWMISWDISYYHLPQKELNEIKDNRLKLFHSMISSL